MELFQSDAKSPLADRMRPQTLDEFVGQEKLLGQSPPLRRAIEEDRVGSIILWGPPGTGKTTIARIIATEIQGAFCAILGGNIGVKEIKQIIAEAKGYGQKGTFLFIDEIHRFNKAQQDAFLPHVEDGTVRLIGATTENPSFEVIGALLVAVPGLFLEPLSIDISRQSCSAGLRTKSAGWARLICHWMMTP